MQREEQIREVERGFADLVRFAGDSWSNLAVVANVKALHLVVKQLYHQPVPAAPVAPSSPLQAAPAPKQRRKPRRPAALPRARRPVLPPAPVEPFEPVHVDATTRWG